MSITTLPPPIHRATHPALRNGFTLVELLIVIIVLAILAALALPSFMQSIEKRRLIQAAEAVYDQVQFARTESLKQARDLLIDVTTDGATNWCVGISANTAGCNCTSATSCVITLGTTSNVEKTLKSADFHQISMTNSSMTNTSYEFVFNRLRGTVESTEAETTLVFNLDSPSGMEIQVTVNRLGTIRMCSPAGANHVGGYPAC